MTLDAWLERLRMMSRSSVVELSPGEVGDLVNAIGPRGDAAMAEREACAKVAEQTNCAAINPSWEAAQSAIAGCIRARRTGA